MRTKCIVPAIATGILLIAGIYDANAQIVALDSNYAPSGSYSPQPTDSTYGWRFTVGSTPLSVTHLGFFDHAQDGLGESHQVGIWNSEGALLTQATVTSSDPLTGNFRFVLASAATLDANANYFIGAHSQNGIDSVIHNGAAPGPTYASEITYLGASLYSGSGFDAPTTPAALAHGVFGPNFQFTPVPEPHEYALVMGIGLVGFILVRRRLISPKAA